VLPQIRLPARLILIFDKQDEYKNRGCFLSREADDAGGLPPAREDNDAGRKAGRFLSLGLSKISIKKILPKETEKVQRGKKFRRDTSRVVADFVIFANIIYKFRVFRL
jgi:hypothetical protein